MKWKILILMVLMAGIVFADGTPVYLPNQKILLGLHLRNTTNEVIGANCSIQLRNFTLNIKLNDVMKEIGNGYYNYTYNTSEQGYYYCRENCTQGTSYTSSTCDFIVKGDEKVSIAVVLVMAIVITFLFILSRYVRIEAIKYLLISISFYLTILTLAIGLFLAKDSLPVPIQNLVQSAYIIVLYTMNFVISILVLFIILYYATKWLPSTFKTKKEK